MELIFLKKLLHFLSESVTITVCTGIVPYTAIGGGVWIAEFEVFKEARSDQSEEGRKKQVQPD